MFDTDKICNYLEKIKNRCDNMFSCKYCILNDKFNECSIVRIVRKLNDELAIEPNCWNIEAIKDILEEE